MTWLYDINNILGGNPILKGGGDHIDYNPASKSRENIKANHVNYLENAVKEVQVALDEGNFMLDSLTLIELEPQHGDFKSLEIQWTQDSSNYTDQYGIYFDNPLGSGSGNLTAMYIENGYGSGIYSLSNSYFSDIETSSMPSLNNFYTNIYSDLPDPSFAQDAATKDYVDDKFSSGWSGTFTNGDGDTVTVTNGLITSIVTL